MSTMLSAPRNRGIHGIDDPIDADGFWRYRKFKGHRKGGQPTGSRLWHRALRRIEQREVRAEIEAQIRDVEDEDREVYAEDLDGYRLWAAWEEYADELDDTFLSEYKRRWLDEEMDPEPDPEPDWERDYRDLYPFDRYIF